LEKETNLYFRRELVMNIRNVHRRRLADAQSVRRVGGLLDSLASERDRLWPRDRWPAMRFDRPLQVGARGGHGPVRYWVEHYEPGQRVRFRFERPRGLHGFHEFHLVTDASDGGELVHLVEARLTGTARLSWPLVFRPLHDALIEQALDNAETAADDRPASPRWSAYVRGLRRLLARRSQPAGQARRHEPPPALYGESGRFIIR
jgi:hypothetical protein